MTSPADRSGPTIGTVLLDLDGVIRHFDPDHLASVERANGLAPGALMAAAFAPSVLEPVITGHVTRRAWATQVGDLVGSPKAAEQWMAEPGRIDWQIMDLVDELRRRGFTVAVLTNGTDTIARELADFGIDSRFDAVFNSAEIGAAKPDRRAFEHVCHALGVEPQTVFFTDDSPSKLGGALELGMTARPFVGVDAFRADLTECVGITL